jgi:hypothetical protein
MRDAWTDERLDDLACRLDAGFGRMDAELRMLRSEIGETHWRIDSLQRSMLQGFSALGAPMLTGFVALFALIATRF